MTTTISIEGIRCYAFHGCMEEEGLIGGEYLVDVTITKDLQLSMESDDLKDTVDYVMVSDVVREQMSIRSKLIEHVGGRILKILHQNIPGAKSIELKINKMRPPVNGDVASAVFTVCADFPG
ncbi:MAG: dihydroneopterin aldolase [Bacteroidota bacterium]